MISCYELRIGNYVLAGQKLQRITAINGNGNVSVGETTDAPADEYLLETIGPVLLTDAILKQCGFVYHEYFKFWQLVQGTDAGRSEMDMDKDYSVIDYMRKPMVKNLTALHQLQNIYFVLKGRELAPRFLRVGAPAAVESV